MKAPSSSFTLCTTETSEINNSTRPISFRTGNRISSDGPIDSASSEIEHIGGEAIRISEPVSLYDFDGKGALIYLFFFNS
jgi:hypothetical protein